MKKLFILSTIMLSTPLWAQTYIQNARNINDIAASSYQIAPGVSISPPMWARNLGNNNTNTPTYSNNNNSTDKTSNTIPNGELTPGITATTNPNNIGSNVNAPSPNQKNIVDNKNQTTPPVQPNNIAPLANSQPLVAPKPLPKPAVLAESISSWNKTTQQEIETKSNSELQEKYKAFLMQK